MATLAHLGFFGSHSSTLNDVFVSCAATFSIGLRQTRPGYLSEYDEYEWIMVAHFFGFGEAST